MVSLPAVDPPVQKGYLEAVMFYVVASGGV